MREYWGFELVNGVYRPKIFWEEKFDPEGRLEKEKKESYVYLPQTQRVIDSLIDYGYLNLDPIGRSRFYTQLELFKNQQLDIINIFYRLQVPPAYADRLGGVDPNLKVPDEVWERVAEMMIPGVKDYKWTRSEVARILKDYSSQISRFTTEAEINEIVERMDLDIATVLMDSNLNPNAVSEIDTREINREKKLAETVKTLTPETRDKINSINSSLPDLSTLGITGDEKYNMWPYKGVIELYPQLGETDRPEIERITQGRIPVDFKQMDKDSNYYKQVMNAVKENMTEDGVTLFDRGTGESWILKQDSRGDIVISNIVPAKESEMITPTVMGTEEDYFRMVVRTIKTDLRFAEVLDRIEEYKGRLMKGDVIAHLFNEAYGIFKQDGVYLDKELFELVLSSLGIMVSKSIEKDKTKIGEAGIASYKDFVEKVTGEGEYVEDSLREDEWNADRLNDFAETSLREIRDYANMRLREIGDGLKDLEKIGDAGKGGFEELIRNKARLNQIIGAIKI